MSCFHILQKTDIKIEGFADMDVHDVYKYYGMTMLLSIMIRKEIIRDSWPAYK